MKRNIATADNIEATRLLLEYSTEPQKIIDAACKSVQLTPGFIREFRQYMTKENFTLSYKLTPEMADTNPDLFSEEILKEHYKDGLVDCNISLPMLAKYRDICNQTAGDEDYYSEEGSTLAETENLKSIIRDATESELTEDATLAFLGYSTETDDLLLKRIKNEDAKNSMLLSLSLNDDKPLTSATYKYLNNDMKEMLLGTEDVNPRDFINALSESKDLGWILNMINNVESGNITLQETTKNLENEILPLLNNLPEDAIVTLVKFSDKLKNTFNYRIMKYLLENKSFSEKQLIEILPEFKQAGMYFDLKKFAQANNYKELLSKM